MKTRIKNFFPSLTFSSPFLTFLFPLLLTFLTLFAASIASAQIPSTGLVGYWPFNGNANDESGNGNNGTVNGATLTTDRFGNANSAYNFNGAGNLISLQGGSNIQGNNPRSISFWANMPSGITNTHTVYKGGVNGSGNDFTIWLVVLSDNTYRLQVRRYQNDPVTIQMPVVANQWINFCVTYDGTINSNVKIYINGVQQPGVSTNGGDNLIFNTISTTPEFGHMVDQLGVHRYMNGKLDDISIYNRALTPSEITQLYTDQTSTVATPPCPTLATNLQTGLVGYWPFCGNANDESGNGHHAINSGATLSTDRFGNINSSYSFNGQSYMTVPDIASAGNSPRTFSVWAYFNSVSYTEFSNYMISTGTPAQSSAFNLRLYLGKLNIMGFDNDYQNESGALVSSMAWHHCLIAYDGMNLMFYLDGQLQGSVTASFSTNGQTNYFGKSNHVGNELFLNGQMDDIGIWNRALTPTEITQLYTDPSTSPPVACTTFLGEDQTFCAGGNVTLSSNFSSCSGLTIPSTWNYVGSYGFSTYYIDPTSKNIPNWLSYLTSISPNAQLVCVETPGESQFLYTALLSYFSSHSSFTPWCGAFQNTSSPSFSEPSGGWQWYNGGQWGNLPWAQTQPDNYQGVQQNARLDYGSQPYLAMDDIESSYTTGALIEISCPYSILWSTGATTATINVTPTTTTTFTCTVTDANGNVCIDSVTVFVPQIEATDLTICAGETTTLSVSGINSTATPSACPTLPTNLQTGLVGYWPFCGNANDASGNGNSGTVNGATLTTDRFGSANNAYSFSTIDQNFIAVSQNGMSNDSGTYVAWINFDGPIAEGNPNLFLDWYTVIDPLMLNSNSNSSNYRKLLFNLNNQPTSSENLTFYDWHQIAVTVEPNANVTFFIDGINCGSQSITNSYSLVSFSNLFLIGKSSNNAWYWNGKIDDITIYNRALSPSEIQQLYTLGQTTYLWSNGATTPTINVSPSTTTTYTCTITTNGVSCTDSVTVVVSNPVIDLGADVTICGNSTTLTAPSGYDSYSWSNGATTNTTTVTANGTYSCTVIQGGCSATDAVDVTLVNATVSASDSTICAGQSVTLSVPQGGSTSTACAALPTNLQTGLVGYWPFCGNANDASGNGNNGTVNGATFTSDRFGNAGNALAFFDQYDRVVLNNVSLNSVSNYTVSIWYNKVPGSGGGSLYCSSNVYSTDGLRMGLDGNNLAAFGAEYLAGSVWSYSNQNATVNSQWHLFTAVLESTPGQVITSNNLKIYIDGNYQSTYQMAWGNPSAVYSPVSNNGLLSLIGNETWGSQDSFKGLLDDVAIYNRAITASEIQQLYTLGPTTYLWSNGATTPTINVTPTTTTTYTCTVTNNGVSCTDSVTVVVSNPVIDLGADFTVCGTTTTLTAPSGYDSYLWSNGGTTSTTTVTANGTYSCTVTQGGCSASDSINVTLNDATITASDTTICAGETVTLSVSQLTSLPVPNALIGFNGPFVFQGHTYFASTTNVTWSEANLISQSTGGYLAIPNSLDENIFLAQNIFTPTTTQYIGVSDAAIEGLFQDVQGNNLLFSNWAPNEPNNYMNNNEDYVEMYSWGGWNDLPGGSLSMLWPFVIEFNNANPSNQILWSNGATTPTINVSPTSTTTYTCTVTTNGVSCTDSVTVVVSNPVIDLGADVTVCGTSTTLTAPSGYDSYLWSNGGTTNTTTVSANGSYSCTVTQGGCSATDAVDVTLVNATVSASDSTICAGQTITLSVPQGGSSSAACAALPTNLQTGLVGYWPFCGNANDASGNGNNGTVNGATLTTDRFGNANSAYSFDGVDDFISMLPTADYPECTVSLYYKLNSINDVNGIGALFSSNWYKFMHIQVGSQGGLNHGVAAYPNSSISCVVGEFIPDNQQWRNVIVTYDGDFLKFYSNGVLVGQNNCGQGFPIQSSLTNYVGRGFVDLRFFKGKIDEVILLNRNISPSEIQQLFTLGQTTYLWSNGATTPTINVSPTSTTTYTCTVTTNGVSCTDDITVVVSQPVASITPNGIVEICQGQSIALTANGGTSYLWNTGAPTQSITVNTEGLYTVTATDANGCTDTESQFVKVNFLPNIGVNNASICPGQSTTLTATGGLSYEWSPASGLSSTTGTSVTASPSISTVYTVTGTGANGCTNIATAAVAVNAAPTATITPATATTFCQGGSVVLNANTGAGLSYQWRLNGTNITGATSSSYTANASGSYTVVVTNTSTCSATSTASVVTVNALPTATITAATATTFCQGGSVVLNANTGTGLSYQWRLNGTNITGATSASYTANASGSYTVVVTNTSTCSATSTATVVTVNALPTATITPATATTFCQGGSVVLTANTGAGLSYQWRLNGTNITGATTSSYTANASGSYTVVVTNTSACSATSTPTVVTVNALPTATITASSATTFCQGGSVVLNANTGTGLSYQWRLNGTNITGATSSSYTANASGSYTVVVTNTSTCSATSTATVVTVNALPTATITPANATTFCQGGSVVLTANTGTGLSYQWYNNASAISGATSSSYTANANGSYTVVVTNTSTCSATSTATVVTVNALPTATITPATATTFCQGGSVVLNANTGAGLSYQWYNNATIISGATTSSYTANASGSYTVVVTNTSTCSATSTATVVTVNALPIATITPASATTFCQGGSVVLNANTGTGLSYQWRLNGTNITGATSSSYTANASGSYTVVVTNTSTCSATSTATVVTVNALPTATITASSATTFCQGGSVVLTANTGTGLSYQWFNNAVAISGATSSSYTANASGSYTVVVTNTSTCSATSTATVVTVNALPTSTITPASATTFCQSGSVVLTANIGTGLTYQWRLNGTNITGATSSTYTANASGSYTVVVTNTSTCSATSTATVVTVNALPTATITSATATTFCQGGSVVLTANTGTGLSYQWYNNAAIISGSTSASYTANASGSYTVVVTNTSACSATSSATVVTVNALPTATITASSATTFCQGGSVVLNANTGAGLSYQWFNNAVAISGATTSTHTANASGSYTVVVTNTSTCSATSTATVVTVNALPAATITPATATTFCQGGSVVLNANTGTGLTYQWRLNGTNITGATTSSYTVNASGSYTVVVTNASTCSATSTATVVTVNALPTATITASSATTFCQGGSVVLNANTGTGLSYQWRLNGTNITGATTSTYTANASGSYTVVVTNTSTCSATSTATVVTVNALPTATITPATATTFCQGGSVVLNANTGTGFSYQWFNNAVAISGATSASYTANASGSYTVVVTNTSTCSATSAAINVTAVPNVNYYADADGDGFGDAATLVSTCVQPQGYVTDNTDCDDTSADVNPAANEVCNHIDDDCSGTIDDGLVFDTYYADVDGDTFGDANNSIYECSQPSGYVTNNTDCNDNNANQNAASAEICNGEDDDCDGAIDNGLIFLDYYADLDSDGFGAGAATNSCVDLGAGYVTNNTDCNDNNANQNTASTEICNGEDDDCDGTIDNGITFLDYYADADGDGFGAGDVISSCSDLGAGYVSNNTDCDDSNSNINSSATETCNTIDDNCDGQIDEGVQTVYFIDNDGDTYGNPSVSILACTQPIGYTPDDTDCNDTDANINPGAEDIGGNGIDENCDGQIDNSIFELNATISLYPNPTRSELNIQVNSSIIGNDLYIFDAVGKLVFKQQLLSTQTIIPVSNFADGNYVVRVGEVVKRFEVMK